MRAKFTLLGVAVDGIIVITERCPFHQPGCCSLMSYFSYVVGVGSVVLLSDL